MCLVFILSIQDLSTKSRAFLTPPPPPPPPPQGGEWHSKKNKIEDAGAPSRALPPVAKWVSVVVGRVCLLVVLISHLGRCETGLIEMLNGEVPVAGL